MLENLAQVLQNSAEKFSSLPAFLYKNKEKEYLPFTYKELYETALDLAESLIKLGVGAKDHVGLIADNRLEWIIADSAVICCGAADVPRGTDITDTEMVYILTHSDAKITFIEDDKIYEQFKRNKAKIKNIKTVIMMDPNSTIKKSPSLVHMKDLILAGRDLRFKGEKNALKRINGIKPDHLFTLIYTSGTTGLPKGVMLSHANMMHQLIEIVPLIHVNSSDRILSILPVWHIFERVFEYISIYAGCSTYYTNVRDLRGDFAKSKPTFMASAPRLWESIYLGIYNKIKDPKITPPVKKALFFVAYFFSKNFNSAVRFLKGLEVDYVGRNILVSLLKAISAIFKLILFGPFTLSIVLLILAYSGFFPSTAKIYLLIFSGIFALFNSFLLDFIVLSKIREATGGKLKASVSGGGALPSHVDAFFNDIGINVLEGYGLTETSPVVAVRTFERIIMGSVGPLIPKTSVQIRGENGEILTHLDAPGNLVSGKRGQKGIVFIKGPQVMLGYYKNPEATRKVLKDGWFDTGDIGLINFKNTLTLSGRAKDTIVLLGGENAEPVPIENLLGESPYINQVMVIGQDKKNLGAIINPDFPKLEEWCVEHGINEKNSSLLIKNPDVIEFFKQEVKRLNNTKAGFKAFEQVQQIILIDKAFAVGDELTAKFSLKRHVIAEKYKKEIEKIYS